MLSISSSSLGKGNQKCFPRRCYETLLKIKKNRIWTCLLGLWFLVLMLICRQLRSRVTLSNVKSPQILLSSIKNDWALQTLWISSKTLITTVYLANWPVYKLEVNFSPRTHLESVNNNESCVWWCHDESYAWYWDTCLLHSPDLILTMNAVTGCWSRVPITRTISCSLCKAGPTTQI